MGKSGPHWRSKGPHKHFVLRLQVKIRNHSFSFVGKLTIPGGHDLTFGFKIDAMRCKICFQMLSRRHSSLYIAIGPAPDMIWFLDSGAQGWHNAVHNSLTSSNLCDVCGQSLFIHSSSPSRYRFWFTQFS